VSNSTAVEGIDSPKNLRWHSSSHWNSRFSINNTLHKILGILPHQFQNQAQMLSIRAGEFKVIKQLDNIFIFQWSVTETKQHIQFTPACTLCKYLQGHSAIIPSISKVARKVVPHIVGHPDCRIGTSTQFAYYLIAVIIYISHPDRMKPSWVILIRRFFFPRRSTNIAKTHQTGQWVGRDQAVSPANIHFDSQMLPSSWYEAGVGCSRGKTSKYRCQTLRNYDGGRPWTEPRDFKCDCTTQTFVLNLLILIKHYGDRALLLLLCYYSYIYAFPYPASKISIQGV